MDLCRQLAEWHLLLWAVPFVIGLVLAGIGSRAGHRALVVLALVGVGWPLLQASAAAIFFLWGPAGGFDGLVRISWMTEQLFELGFDLNLVGTWAVLLMGVTCLAAQVYSLAAVARFAGRHRFYALLQLLVASGGVLFTARSPIVMLIGWEGLALTAAFLAGFWESEQRGERTGMRWLLFQRTSGLLLLLGLIGLDLDPQLGLALVVTAALIRAGQLPFHGWLRDSTSAPAPATAVLAGASSTLAAIYLLVQIEDLLPPGGWAADGLGLVGLAGVALGVLASIQQQRPSRAIGWLFVMLGGLSLLGFAVGDPVAAVVLVTSQTLVLGGLALAVGTLVGPVAEIRAAIGAPGLGRARRATLVLAIAWLLPPSIGFVGLGRLLTAAQGGGWFWPVMVSTCAGALAGGWVAARIQLRLTRLAADRVVETGARTELWMAIAPAGLATLALALGVAAVSILGWDVVGGWTGVGLAGLVALSGALGTLGAWLVGRRQLGWLSGRLSRPQRIMERIAETGLGIGEILVQLPIFVARALGVLVWRVLGDVVIDTLIVGTTYKTVEGVGFALRMLQNGRVQRYALIAVLTVLGLVVAMLR